MTAAVAPPLDRARWIEQHAEDFARVHHDSYFAHPWEDEDGASRACALQAARAVAGLAWDLLRPAGAPAS